MFTRIILPLALFFFTLACSEEVSAPEEPPVCTESCESSEEAVETTKTLVATDGLAGGLEGDLSSAVYNATTGTFTVTGANLNAQMNRFSTADFGEFLAMRDAVGTHNAYFAKGQGIEVVVYSGGTAGSVKNLASYGRIGATELPLIGSARFSGDYVGFTTTRRINGTAQIDVSFARETISGRITDRIFRQRPDNVADVVNPLSTLVLEETLLRDDGSFYGKNRGWADR